MLNISPSRLVRAALGAGAMLALVGVGCAHSAAPKETIAQHYFAAHEMVRAYEHARAAAALARDALAFGRCVSMLELAASTGVASTWMIDVA